MAEYCTLLVESMIPYNLDRRCVFLQLKEPLVLGSEVYFGLMLWHSLYTGHVIINYYLL